MGTISVSLPTDGTTADVADVNTPITTIVNEINGNLDNANIKTGAAIDFAKIAGGNSTALSALAAFTPTVVGWSGTPTVTCRYTQIGALVFVTFSIVGTSNATSATMTLPVAALNSGVYDGPLGYSQNAGSEITAGSRWFIDPAANASLVNFYSNTAFAAWTASSQKLVRGWIIYQAA